MQTSLNNIKRFLLYIIYILPLLYISSWVEPYTRYLKLQITSPGDFYNWSLVLCMALVPIFIGLMFALPRFVILVKKEGSWRFDWVKFLAIGLPTSFGALFPAVFWLGIELPPFPFPAWMMQFPLSGIIFGYIFLESFEKNQIIREPATN